MKVGNRRNWLKEFYRHKLAITGVFVLCVLHVAAFLAPWLAPYSPEAIEPGNPLAGSSKAHWLGTDDIGRDTLSRLLHGGRISLVVGMLSMIIGVAIGTMVGALGGYFGGALDLVFMRITDALMSIPRMFLLIILMAVFQGGVRTVVVVVGLTSWMEVARLVRSEVLMYRNRAFVEAAEALGASRFRIITRHIIPQCVGSIVVAATLGVGRAILAESSMSFLGMGVQPPTPSWGNMLTHAQRYIWRAPEQALYPGVAIFMTVLSYNFVGDGLRDALDPKAHLPGKVKKTKAN
ncbi:MAG: ABC transporter permease [Bacillota bacterium]|jgi:peptide/nickel transport system permease protein